MAYISFNTNRGQVNLTYPDGMDLGDLTIRLNSELMLVKQSRKTIGEDKQ